MDKLIEYIGRYVCLDDDAVRAVQECAEVEVYKKNEFILRPGQYCNKIWFISEGMLRKYFLRDGEEITLWIHCENEIITSLNSYFHQLPAEEYLQACEKLKLISISKEKSRMLACIPSIMQFTNTMMGEHFARIDSNTREFNQLDARSKYEFLRSVSPEMVKRAKLGHIASVMGVHPSTLSRIRKEK